MSLVRLRSIIRKEFIHIFRDPRTLIVIFLIPVIQLILLGYAVTTDIKHLPTAVLDQDRTPESRDLISTYQASDYFNIKYYADSQEALTYLVDSARARAAMIIPSGYGHDLLKENRAAVAFIIDGSDPAVASTAFAAAQSVGQSKGIQIIQRRLNVDPARLPGIDVRPRVWYNPEMRSSHFMIPALMGLILQFLTTFLTALSIVREKEQGTIEQLVVTPIKPVELVLGKVTPYVVVAFFDFLEVLVIGIFWFGVPVHGSLPLLLALAALFLLTSLGLGLFISALARSQQEAMLLTVLVLFPSIFLSGFFFPLEAMPAVLQAISLVIPLRYLLAIIRGIVLKGVGLDVFFGEAIALIIFGVVILTAASRRFTKTLE